MFQCLLNASCFAVRTFSVAILLVCISAGVCIGIAGFDEPLSLPPGQEMAEALHVFVADTDLSSRAHISQMGFQGNANTQSHLVELSVPIPPQVKSMPKEGAKEEREQTNIYTYIHQWSPILCSMWAPLLLGLLGTLFGYVLTELGLWK